MLKQRTINLAEDEVLIIKQFGATEELAEIRVFDAIDGDIYVAAIDRPFATLIRNPDRDTIREMIIQRKREQS